MQAKRVCASCSSPYEVRSSQEHAGVYATRCPPCRAGKCVDCGGVSGRNPHGDRRVRCAPCAARRHFAVLTARLRKCLGCGRWYFRSADRSGKDGLSYCSRACCFTSQRGKGRPSRRKPPAPPRAPKSCRVCGEGIVQRKGWAVRCSPACDKVAARLAYLKQYPERSVECAHCGEAFVTTSSLKKTCSRRCRKRHNAAQHRRISKQRRRGRQASQRTGTIRVADVWRKSRGLCHLCGAPCVRTSDPTNLQAGTLDHVVPLAMGGAHGPENVRLAHRICNSRKGAKLDVTAVAS